MPLVFERPAVAIGAPNPTTLGLAKQVVGYLAPRVERVILQEGLISHLKGTETLDNVVEQPLRICDADLVVAIGGDGTILRVSREVAREGGSIPIFPVNRGRRGFLAEVSPLNLEEYLQRALDGLFILEVHKRLEAEAEDQKLPSVLNEFLITSSELLRVVDIATTIDDVTLDPIRGDGIIVSTPAGSTGHALSAGGAILAAPLPAIILAWICPLNLMLGTRSLIVSDLATISVRVSSREDSIKVVADGQRVIESLHELTINIKAGESTTRFVRFNAPVHRLKGKLSL